MIAFGTEFCECKPKYFNISQFSNVIYKWVNALKQQTWKTTCVKYPYHIIEVSSEKMVKENCDHTMSIPYAMYHSYECNFEHSY